MKRLFLLFAASMLLWGCSSDEPVMSLETDQNLENVSNIRTPEEAIAIAEGSYSNFFKTASRSSISANKNVIAVPSHSFGSARSGNDTVLYIVNFEDNKGFAIVNAIKSGNELLGISDQGNYDQFDRNANPPGLEMLLDDYQNASREAMNRAAIRDSVSRPPLIYEDWEFVTDTLFNELVEPKVKANWSQGGLFGEYCSNYIVGCGPLALGAGLTVFKPFQSLQLTFPGKPASQVSLPWDEMINLNTSNYGYVNLDVANATALYLRQIGHLMNATYSPILNGLNEGTYTNIDQNRATAQKLCANTGLTVSDVTSNLKNTYPNRYTIRDGILIMRGDSGEFGDNTGSGHAWIVDGYKYVKIKDELYAITILGVKTLKETNYYESYYIHINWGWGGKSNGYFDVTLKSLFDTSRPWIPDNKNQENNNITFKSNYRYYSITPN